MKIKVWVYIHDCGDGSAHMNLFNTEAEAEHYASFDDQRFCEDIYQTEIVLDKNNKIAKIPKHYKEEDGA